MKILVIGSSGFLGTNLINRLSKDIKINGIDRLKNDNNKIQLFEQKDISSINKNDEVLKNVTHIFYRAGILGGPESIDITNSKKFIKINTEKMIHFFSKIDLTNIKKIFFDSTEQVFGDYSKTRPNLNNSEPLPKNFYGLSKLLCEKFLINLAYDKKINIDIFRYPRIVNGESFSVIDKMIMSCIQNKTIKVRANPKQKITFLHLDDAIDANIVSLNSNQKYHNFFRILNLSNNEFVTILKLAKIIKNKINNDAKIIIDENFPVDFQPFYTNMKSHKTSKLLKWFPKYNLNKIIDEKIRIYKINAKL